MYVKLMTAAVAVVLASGLANAGDRWHDRDRGSAVSADLKIGKRGSLLDVDVDVLKKGRRGGLLDLDVTVGGSKHSRGSILDLDAEVGGNKRGRGGLLNLNVNLNGGVGH